MKYAIIGVEGSHDQAFTGKVLKLLGLKDFREELKGLESQLDPFWRKFIPVYPKKGWGGDKEVYEIDCIRVAARIPCW